MLFTAEWCGSCQSLNPVLVRIQQEFEGRVQFIIIDIDKIPLSINRFAISSVPTLMLYKNGEELWRKAGLLTTYELRSAIKKYLNPEEE